MRYHLEVDALLKRQTKTINTGTIFVMEKEYVLKKESARAYQDDLESK